MLLTFLSDNQDYLMAYEELNFTSGSTVGAQLCVEIAIINDTDVECDDVFTAKLATNFSVVTIPMESDVITITISMDSADGRFCFLSSVTSFLHLLQLL